MDTVWEVTDEDMRKRALAEFVKRDKAIAKSKKALEALVPGAAACFTGHWGGQEIRFAGFKGDTPVLPKGVTIKALNNTLWTTQRKSKEEKEFDAKINEALGCCREKFFQGFEKEFKYQMEMTNEYGQMVLRAFSLRVAKKRVFLHGSATWSPPKHLVKEIYPTEYNKLFHPRKKK